MHSYIGTSSDASSNLDVKPANNHLPSLPHKNPNSYQSSISRVFSNNITLMLAALGVSVGSMTAQATETVTAPTWASKTTLQGCGAIQSNSNSGGATRAGFQKTVTNELKNASTIQISWGIQARDIGSGLNVSNWRPYLEVRSLNGQSSTVVATIRLNINDFVNLDGTPIQKTTIGTTTTFVPSMDYGTSSSGKTNYVFSYAIKGEDLARFQNSLVIGQEMAFFLINESNSNEGIAYTLGSPSVLNKGGNQLATLNSVNLDTLALPTMYNTGLAFELNAITHQAIVTAKEPKLSIHTESGQAIVDLVTENDGQKYTILRSTDLKNWVPCSEHIGDGSKHTYTESISAQAYFTVNKITTAP